MFRLILGFCAISLAAQADIVINEVLVFNRNAEANGADYPDCIELRNTGASTVDVSGYTLTDDPLLPAKYAIPGITTIGPGGNLVLYADSALTSPGLHTSFGLNSDGDKLMLLEGGTVIDSVTFGPQAPDISIGRIPNGTGTWQACTPTIGHSNVAKTLGSVTSLKINEWMANPAYGEDWFEIYNTDANPVALAGLYLSDNPAAPRVNQLPALSFIAGKGFQRFWASVKPTFTVPPVVRFQLSSKGDSLVLTQANGITAIDRITFGSQTSGVSQGRMPDGGGKIASMPVSESLQNPNWVPTSVVINEVLANGPDPLEDAVELYNTSASPVNVGGWWLSDDLYQRKKYQIPGGTTIAAGGYLVIYENQWQSGAVPFSLLARGDEVFLSAVDAVGNLTGYGSLVRFGATEPGVSIGRVAATGLNPNTGGAEFWRQSARSFGRDNPASREDFRTGTGAANAAPRIGPVTINEIMYHPPEQGLVDYTATEFVELFNITNSAVDLSGWRLKGDVEFLMPGGASIPAHGYILLVGFDPTIDTASLNTFRAAYGLGSGSPAIYGPYSEKLSNATMSVEFAKPITLDGSPTFENVDKVEYRDYAPWPLTADGLGKSLQRASSFVFGNTAANWTGNTPTPGALNTGVLSSVVITTASPLIGGVLSTPYTNTLTVSGGFDPYVWSVTGGTLPPSITLDSSGVLSGTPSVTGTYTFTARATDALSFVGSKSFTIIIAATAPSVISTSPLTDGTTGTPYPQPLAGTGGTAPYKWSITSGAPPDGLTMSSAGVLEGVPTTAGTFSFTAQLVDLGGLVATKAFTLTMVQSPITITTSATLVAGVKSVPYSQQTLTATGGTTPYFWTLYNSELPPGLTISNAGVISGTPTLPGVYSFIAQLTDGGSIVAAKVFSLTVYATYQTPIMNPITLGSTTVGTSCTFNLSAARYPKTFTVIGLPRGLTLNTTTGVITGRPLVSGVFMVRAKATNPGGTSAIITAPLVVKALPSNLVGSFTGLVARNQTANGGLGARLTLTTTSSGSYTVKLTKGATTTSAIGFLNTTSPHVSVTIGGAVLSLTLNPVTHLVTGGHGSALVNGWHSAWSAFNPATTRIGYYSVGIDLADSGDHGVTGIPQGSGYASFVVAAAGTLTVTGKTADGQAISSAGFLGPNGEIAVYTSLYGNLGSIAGRLNLAEDNSGAFDNNTASGTLTWFKPTSAVRAYKTTFGPINLSAYGKYLAPAASGRVIVGLPDPGNAALSFTDGGLGLAAINPSISAFDYSAANVVTMPAFASGNNPAKTTLAINKSTGAVGGTFTLVDTLPALSRKVTYQGMVVRPASGNVKAKGYFLLLQKPLVGETIKTSPILSGGVQITQ